MDSNTYILRMYTLRTLSIHVVTLSACVRTVSYSTTTGERSFMLYRQSRWKRFDRTNVVVILYLQHVHYDITIDRADVVVVRTNLLGRQNNMCKKQHLLFDTYVINAYLFSIGSTHRHVIFHYIRTCAIKYVLITIDRADVLVARTYEFVRAKK